MAGVLRKHEAVYDAVSEPTLGTLATRFVPFRDGGEWHLWETLVVLAIGLFAIAFSIYVVYLLEIVKLANPRVRRREREEAETSERLSA